jgi:hypothetical protein
MSQLQPTVDSINSQISSIKDAVEISKSEKQLKKSAGNSLSKGVSQLATQLDKISQQQKRYQREPPSSMDNLFNMITATSGGGSQSLQYLRKTLLNVAVKIQPDVQRIIKEESLKALGCSQEQTYKGISKSNLQLNPMSTLPASQGIYIPISNLDFFGNLKNSPDSKVGKVYYEQPEPSTDDTFIPYGGEEAFPMNKEFYNRTDSQNVSRSFYDQYGKYYQGKSQQDLFDIQYTKTNEFGVSGDYYRVILIDRENLNLSNSSTTVSSAANQVGEFLNDYYSTIKLIDPVDIGAQVVNLLSGAVKMEANLGTSQLSDQSKFSIILQRILGLCFDNRREIDVSGISKIAELDGVDDTFFEMTEIDLRNIDLQITNIQNRVMEFEDCDNIKVPVDYGSLVDELIEFRETLSGQTTQQQVATIEKIIDSISQNPDWKIYLNADFNPSVSINTNVIKKLPLAVAAGVLTPKVLFPIFTMLSVIQTEGKNSLNTAITSANTFIASGNTVGGKVNNIVNDGSDYLQKFRKFNIEVVSKIGAIFLRTLFEVLKKDIINLLSVVIGDIANSNKAKQYAIILRLVQIALLVLQILDDARKCKSLLDNILLLLKLINNAAGGIKLPAGLAGLASALPGTSPERATINGLQVLQSVGIPTGTLPDGSPNLMGFYMKAVHRGADKENAENGKLIIEPDLLNPGKLTGKPV